MNRHPGFTFDAARKRARFDCYVPGTAGKVRRRRTVAANDRAEALTLWRRFVDELATARTEREAEIPPAVDAMSTQTLREFVDAYFDKIAAGLKKSTRRSHRSIISRRLLPHFGNAPLQSITAVGLADFKVSLRGKFSASYINGCIRVLKMLLRQAVERDVIRDYPIKKKVGREREELLRLEMTDAEREAFLFVFDDLPRFSAYLAAKQRKGGVASSSHFRLARAFGGGLRGDSKAAQRYFERFQWLKPLFLVAFETGLRRGDLRRLRWSSIDTRDGWIRVRMEKTGFEATIPISRTCADAIAVCRLRSVMSAYVFVDQRGRQVSETRIRRTYALAKKLAGITRRCRFHDLRHTFASRLVSRGVSLRVVATALGHTTTEQTERYAKPSEDAMRQIKRALDAE